MIAELLLRARMPPEGVPPWPKAHFSHQPYGVEWLATRSDAAKGRVCQGCALLGDDTGGGKTKQAIDAAQVLFALKEVQQVIVVPPGDLRSMWFDKDLGELAKHLWLDMPSRIIEYHARTDVWFWKEQIKAPRLDWYISNYEFLRSPERLADLLPVANHKTLLICDESAELRNWNSDQTRAMRKLRKKCGWVWELNGTPIADKPFDVFSQANLMDSGILGITSMTKFKDAFANMGGLMVDTPWGKVATQVLSWKNLDVLQQRMAPYVLRRLKDDMGLPPKIPPVVLTVPLTPSTWERYKAMRDDMVVELSNTQLSMTQQTMTKVMRLAQITSGFLGGVEQMDEIEDDSPWGMSDDGERLIVTPDAPRGNLLQFPVVDVSPTGDVVEIGREKMDALHAFLRRKLDEDPCFKLLIFTRFRPELMRVVNELRAMYANMDVGTIYGGNKGDERRDAKRLMDPRTTPRSTPSTVVMTSAGARGNTLTASHTMLRMSRNESLYIFKQGEDRIHRPTQVHPVSYYDMIAVGPRGQRTIDKDIMEALLAKNDVAEWTTSAWVTRMREAA